MSKHSRTTITALATACGVMYGVTASAASDPAYFHWGVAEVTPELTTGLRYDDNLYRDQRKISTPVIELKPSVDFQMISGLNNYSAQLQATNRTYTRVHAADSTDFGASGQIHHEFTSRHRIQLDGGWGTFFDEGSEVGSSGALPRFERKQLEGTYTFGAQTTAHVDLFSKFDNREYRDTAFNDRSIVNYGSTFYYPVMPNTDALLEVSRRELEYPNEQDAGYDITNYLLGLRWDTSAKTVGFAKIGRRNRDLQAISSNQENYTGWELGISYLPQSYSVIQLSTGRDYGLESDDPQSPTFTKGSNIHLTWEHNWTDRISSRTGWRYVDEEVVSAAGASQKDRNVNTWNIGVDWNLRRWVTLALDWSYTRREESARQAGVFEDNYQRNTFRLSGHFSL